MEKSQIEEILSKSRMPPPENIFVLSAPIIYPEFKSVALGLNPRFERKTVVLGSNATTETVIHETLHTIGLGELLTYPLARFLARRLQYQPRKRSIRYEEREVSSDRLERYGLHTLVKQNGYQPGRLQVKQLKLNGLRVFPALRTRRRRT